LQSLIQTDVFLECKPSGFSGRPLRVPENVTKATKAIFERPFMHSANDLIKNFKESRLNSVLFLNGLIKMDHSG
jgi:hypothetical protein